MEIAVAQPEDLAAAVKVWEAANLARGINPSTGRVERVREKLAASEAVVVAGRLHGEVAAMALAEPWRTAGGLGS